MKKYKNPLNRYQSHWRCKGAHWRRVRCLCETDFTGWPCFKWWWVLVQLQFWFWEDKKPDSFDSPQNMLKSEIKVKCLPHLKCTGKLAYTFQAITPCFQIKSVCCNGSFFCLLLISLLKDTSRLSFASQEGRKTKKLNLAFTLFTLI